MRIDKFLSNAGVATRSEIKRYFKDNRITINDVLIKQAKTQIDPNKDVVKVDDKIIEYKAFYYFVLNKPKGCVSANEDDLYPTVMDYFKDLRIKGLSHVGRLDLDTTGVLLITNDGKLGHYLIAPKFNVKKIYNIVVDKDLDESIINKFQNGLTLENGDKCKPAEIKIVDNRHAKIYLTEGKYHQVKRMMRSVGYEVIELHRELFAFLTTKNAKPGEYYELSESEINDLKKLVNL